MWQKKLNDIIESNIKQITMFKDIQDKLVMINMNIVTCNLILKSSDYHKGYIVVSQMDYEFLKLLESDLTRFDDLLELLIDTEFQNVKLYTERPTLLIGNVLFAIKLDNVITKIEENYDTSD